MYHHTNMDVDMEFKDEEIIDMDVQYDGDNDDEVSMMNPIQKKTTRKIFELDHQDQDQDHHNHKYKYQRICRQQPILPTTLLSHTFSFLNTNELALDVTPVSEHFRHTISRSCNADAVVLWGKQKQFASSGDWNKAIRFFKSDIALRVPHITFDMCLEKEEWDEEEHERQVKFMEFVNVLRVWAQKRICSSNPPLHHITFRRQFAETEYWVQLGMIQEFWNIFTPLLQSIASLELNFMEGYFADSGILGSSLLIQHFLPTCSTISTLILRENPFCGSSSWDFSSIHLYELTKSFPNLKTLKLQISTRIESNHIYNTISALPLLQSFTVIHNDPHIMADHTLAQIINEIAAAKPARKKVRKYWKDDMHEDENPYPLLTVHLSMMLDPVDRKAGQALAGCIPILQQHNTFKVVISTQFDGDGGIVWVLKHFLAFLDPLISLYNHIPSTLVIQIPQTIAKWYKSYIVPRYPDSPFPSLFPPPKSTFRCDWKKQYHLIKSDELSISSKVFESLCTFNMYHLIAPDVFPEEDMPMYAHLFHAMEQYWSDTGQYTNSKRVTIFILSPKGNTQFSQMQYDVYLRFFTLDLLSVTRLDCHDLKEITRSRKRIIKHHPKKILEEALLLERVYEINNNEYKPLVICSLQEKTANRAIQLLHKYKQQDPESHFTRYQIIPIVIDCRLESFYHAKTGKQILKAPYVPLPLIAPFSKLH